MYKKITTIEEVFDAAPMSKNNSTKAENEEDVIRVDVPLMIRLLEYAREDAKNDLDLHKVAKKLIELSEEGEVLSMDHYDKIVK